MSRLPVGLYQPGDSVIHRLDAGTKLLCLIFLLIAVVNTTTVPGYGIWILFVALLIRFSRIAAGTALGCAVRLKWFFSVILLMNLCFYGQGHPWISWWIFRPSFEGLLQGVQVAARVFLLLAMSNVVMVSTAPMAVTDAMERLLSPLGYIGVPTELTAMILSVAIQFIPTIFEEADNIRKAQTARGAGFDSPKILERAEAVLSLLVPVFLAAFKRADELSLAMEARGYRTNSRYGGKKCPALRAPDWAALFLCASLAVIFVIF